jgi:alpha-1,3-mannosyltransferase
VDERVFARGYVSGYTALYYLSDACEGGRTIFYDERGDERCSVTPKIGRALYFRHGVDTPEHEGEEVRSGTKYVLRSDVLFG